MLEIIDSKNLPKCPQCDNEVQLLRNSAGRFQVRCTNSECKMRTGWLSKTEAIISYANIIDSRYRDTDYFQFMHYKQFFNRAWFFVNNPEADKLFDNARRCIELYGNSAKAREIFKLMFDDSHMLPFRKE